MNWNWPVVRAAALAAAGAVMRPATAQISISEVPAVYRGAFTCAAKYPGSFLDVGSVACWQCPVTHPKRTVFLPITVSNACERPATSLFRKASGPVNPTGLIGTDCKSGWFLHWDKKCYSCGSGYNRTADPNVASPRACERVMPAAWTTATRIGVEGCPAGAFRNGVTAHCYACPADYSRNAVIGDDLTKVKACTRISNAVHEATRAKYTQQKNDHPTTKANLTSARAPGASPPDVPPIVRTPEDSLRHAQMVSILENELKGTGGYIVVSWMISASFSAVVGYSRAEGYAMTKVGDVYSCRKLSSDSFVAGITAGAGVTEEIGLSQSPLVEGASETNGWQAGLTVAVGGSYGMHWDASSDKKSVAWSFGVSPSVDVAGEYVHTWEKVGALVGCDAMTWGKPDVAV